MKHIRLAGTTAITLVQLMLILNLRTCCARHGSLHSNEGSFSMNYLNLNLKMCSESSLTKPTTTATTSFTVLITVYIVNGTLSVL